MTNSTYGTNPGDGGHGEDGGHDGHPYDVLLFLFFSEILGALTLVILSRYAPSLPYTAVCFVLGCLLQLIVFEVSDSGSDSAMRSSMEMWNHIDAHLLLYTFLPALIYGDALLVNFHDFKHCIWQILWLAFPGMLLGAFLTALVGHYIFPYDWDWNLSMTLGSILAATDPVAVVALLKEVGASPKLQMVIAGESMLNDGSAIVIFSIFSETWLGKSTFTWGTGIERFVQMAMGGPCIGVAFGAATLGFLIVASRKVVHEDVITQITVTIACAYLAYYVGEAMLHVSGVLTIVFAGITISAFGVPVMIDRTALRTVWHVIEFMGNTLLFMLAGMIWVERIQHGEEDNIGAREVGYLFLLFILSIAIRFIVIFVSWPVLHYTGSRASWQECVVMSWGGLRGAVGLALAMSFDHDTDGSAEQVRAADRMQFYVGGMALLTLTLSGTSTLPLLKKLASQLACTFARADLPPVLQFTRTKSKPPRLHTRKLCAALRPTNACNWTGDDAHERKPRPAARARDRAHARARRREAQRSQGGPRVLGVLWRAHRRRAEARALAPSPALPRRRWPRPWGRGCGGGHDAAARERRRRGRLVRLH